MLATILSASFLHHWTESKFHDLLLSFDRLTYIAFSYAALISSVTVV
jgi:hypothetical protein